MRKLYAFTTALLMSFVSGQAMAQSDTILNRIPPNSNAVIIWNADKVFASPLATKEGWVEQYEKAYASGLASIPPRAKHVVVASDIDVEKWNSVWTMAAFDIPTKPALGSVARQFNGVMDEVNGMPAVALSQNAYIVDLGNNAVAAYAPGNRQAVSRWLRDTSGKSTVSPYIQNAISRSKTSDVVQAFDLVDAIPRAIVEGKIKTSESLIGTAESDINKIISVVSTLQGLTLEVIVKDVAVSRLVVDFGVDAQPLASTGKGLLLEVLGNAGLAIDDMDSWKGRVEGKKFILQGDLTGPGLKKVFQLIDHPVASFVADSDSQNKDESKTAYATQQYYRGISKVIAEIKEYAKKKDVDVSRYARWFDKWSDEIDHQPILNVDPDMITFGQSVAGTLRSCSDAIRGIRINSGAIGAQSWMTSNSDGWFNYAGNLDISQQRRAVKKQQQAQGVTSAISLIRQLEEESSKIRSMMTEKYKMEF